MFRNSWQHSKRGQRVLRTGLLAGWTDGPEEGLRGLRVLWEDPIYPGDKQSAVATQLRWQGRPHRLLTAAQTLRSGSDPLGGTREPLTRRPQGLFVPGHPRPGPRPPRKTAAALQNQPCCHNARQTWHEGSVVTMRDLVWGDRAANTTEAMISPGLCTCWASSRSTVASLLVTRSGGGSLQRKCTGEAGRLLERSSGATTTPPAQSPASHLKSSFSQRR